jgi:hypothetical protein
VRLFVHRVLIARGTPRRMSPTVGCRRILRLVPLTVMLRKTTPLWRAPLTLSSGISMKGKMYGATRDNSEHGRNWRCLSSSWNG